MDDSHSSVKTTRVLVADDHAVVRLGVRNLLASVPGFEMVGEAEDGDTAVTQVTHLDPDILLLDLAMPRLPGLDAMREIMGRSPKVKVIVLTGLITTQQVIEALQIGARGIVLKGAVISELLQAMQTVVNGEYWIGGKRVVNLLQALHELTQKGDGRDGEEDLWADDAGTRSGAVHRGGMHEQGCGEAVHDLGRDGEAASIEHLR